MSDSGSSNNFGFRGKPEPAQKGNSDGPKRDAWNQVIKEEPRQQNNQNNNNNNNNQDDNNNDGIDENTIDNIWEDVKRENSQKPGDNQNNTNNNVVPDKVDPAKQMNDYLLSVGLDPIVLTDKDKEDMSAGNYDTFMGNVNKKIQQAHIKAVASASTLMDKKMEAAVEKAVEKATGIVKGQVNLRELNDALPWTKDKAINPVAQTVMKRFLDRGASTADAIKGVEHFFKHTSKLVGGDEKVNRNRNSNFGSGPSDDGAESWLDVLRQ